MTPIEIEELNEPDYRVWFENNIVFFEGSLRLNGTEGYAPITKILKTVLDSELTTIELNFNALEFLNSSGINTFLKYAISLREKQKQVSELKLIIQGSKNIPWQQKSLPNFKRFFKSSEVHVS
jgi:hypothetical protein